MSKALYKNNAESISAISILAADLSVTLATGAGALFPAPVLGTSHALVTLTDGINYEIVKVTANAADALTIVRAQEGTIALDWPSGTTVSQRLTAAVFESLLDFDSGGTAGVAAGLGSVASSASKVAIGKNCFASQNSSLAMGDACTTTGVLSTAIGKSNTASGRNTVAIGKNCTSGPEDESVTTGVFCNAAGYFSAAIGSNCSATGYYNSAAVGSYCTASGYYSAAIGVKSSASADNSLAVGYQAAASSNGAGAIGYFASASASSSLAAGFRATASAAGSLALGLRQTASAAGAIAIGGSTAVNSLPDSAMIHGPLAIRASFAGSVPSKDFAAAEVVFMTEALPLGAVGSKVVSLPVGSVFIPTSAGIMTTDQTGVITTQPTVLASISTDNITFTPLTPAALMTALSASRTFEDLAIGPQTAAGLYLKGEVTIAGVSTLLYNARFYFKGIVVQE